MAVPWDDFSLEKKFPWLNLVRGILLSLAVRRPITMEVRLVVARILKGECCRLGFANLNLPVQSYQVQVLLVGIDNQN